jgi:regulator of sigma E protease
MAIFLEIITFLIVIIVLILVHEIGHFIVAKLSGMRVDEFGIGLPPRILTFGKIGDTAYTLNWLPFGGFVRIFGEDGVEEETLDDSAGEESAEQPAEKTVATEPLEAKESPTDEASDSDEEAATEEESRSFSSKPRIYQALVLLAGIFMNLLFAYILINVSEVMGTQQLLTYGHEGTAKNITLEFTSVTPGSPADKAGIKAGDEVKGATIIYGAFGIGYSQTNPLGLSTLIGTDTTNAPIQFSIVRGKTAEKITVTPKEDIIAGSPTRPAIGVSISEVGIVKVPLLQAPIYSAKVFWNMVSETGSGLYTFFKGIVTFKANLSQVSGPIGIAGIIGQASASGFAELLSLTALISINLAIINLIPIPALDGGRLLFVIIEAIIERPIPPKIAGRVNLVGFVLLILLMLVVTAHDIFNLFH